MEIDGVLYDIVKRETAPVDEKPKWKILKFRNDAAYVKDPPIFTTLRKNGLYVNNPDPDAPGVFSLENTMYGTDWKIDTVQYKDEVFTIGDDIEGWGKIERFEMHCYKNLEKEVMMVYFRNNYNSCHIGNIKKVKPVLFTTEDGVDIREGDKISMWFVNKFLDPHFYGYIPGWIKDLDKEEKIFSTEEKAKEYIGLHEKKYSKDDILKTLVKIKYAGLKVNYLDVERFKKELGL